MCFLCGPYRDVIGRAVSESQLDESRQLEQWFSCETVTGKNVSTKTDGIVGIRHQVTTGEKI
jgi:hypothetical protein